jgi:crotonobetainyl-CoA:carnitine CoA-transferase CaiB-like acyl-CoA transferase
MLEPLRGTRILEVGEGISSAFAARVLGDLGAQVIKLEGVRESRTGGGDAWAMMVPSSLHAAISCYLDHGKRRTLVDLRTEQGVELARRLASSCDALIVDRDSQLGCFDPLDQRWNERPPIVVFSYYGLVGERASDPGHPFVVEHSSGFAFHQASPVGQPEATPPLHCADFESSLAIGLAGANAALSLIAGRDVARPGRVLDVSSEDVLTYLLVEPFAAWLEGTDVVDRRRKADEQITVAGGLVWLLECSDGAVMVSPREDHQWQRWVSVIGNPEWAHDATLCGDKFIRTENALRLGELMSAWTRTQKAKHVFLQAQTNRVACYPISEARDLLRDEQLQERKFYDTMLLESGRAVHCPGLPFQMTSEIGTSLKRATEVMLRKHEAADRMAWTDDEKVTGFEPRETTS